MVKLLWTSDANWLKESCSQTRPFMGNVYHTFCSCAVRLYGCHTLLSKGAVEKKKLPHDRRSLFFTRTRSPDDVW